MSVFTEPPPAVRLSVVCPTCGTVKLWMGHVTLRICCDNHKMSHRFTCPKCSQVVVKPVKYEQTARRLIREGIPVEWWWLPAECFEMKQHPPITEDDVAEWEHEIHLIERWVNQR